MPNITGGATFQSHGTYSPLRSGTGAISVSEELKINASTSASSSSAFKNFKLNASRCSEVYSDSVTTVTPESLAVAFYIKS